MILLDSGQLFLAACVPVLAWLSPVLSILFGHGAELVHMRLGICCIRADALVAQCHHEFITSVPCIPYQ